MPDYNHDIDEFDEDYKSKSEIKREMLALQDFAFQLVKLSKAERAKVPFTEEVLEALILADKIKNKPRVVIVEIAVGIFEATNDIVCLDDLFQ